MKIMIVDDHKGMREMLRSLVVLPGDEVQELDNAVDAAARYREFRPDIVLMDIVMTEMDGLAATRQIKSDFSDARVLAITECESPGARKAAEEAGACGFLVKDELLRLRELMEKLVPESREATEQFQG